MLCGRRPFEAKTEDELEEQILHREAKPPRQIKDSIPQELERVCLKALSKHVQDRFTTAKDMAEDVLRAIESSTNHKPDRHPVMTLDEIERRMQSADEDELRRLLGYLQERDDTACIPLLFRCLSHPSEAVRKQARKNVHSFGWNKVSEAAEEMARRDDAAGIAAVLDGLAAFESHSQIVALLDRLVVLLKGDLRNRAILLLERKRLGLELDAVAGFFREIHFPYRIEKALGQGLFAAAYLARADGTDLAVVVRVLRPEFVAQPHLRAQFLDLSRRALQLVHKNLVLTREARAFPERNMYFAVRDYVDGVTLQKLLEGGKRFEPVQIVRILKQLVRALGVVHRRGMCHGGVKPSNIFVCEGDRVILGDPALPVQGIGVALERLSYDYRYAAPETFARGTMEPQSDFYSLGCVAYELACGQPPFVSDNYHELAACHMHEAAAPPSSRGSRLRITGDEFLLKLLARSPAQRYAKTEDILQALDRLVSSWRAAEPEVRGRYQVAPAEPEVRPAAAPLLGDASLARFRVTESVVGFDASAASVLPHPRRFACLNLAVPRMGKVLYVGNLPHSMSDSDLKAMFAPHGSVESAQVIMDAGTGGSKGFGFVKMSMQVETWAAIAALNGQERDGRVLTVKQPRPVGNYDIIEPLGQGGMGVVYKAFDQRLQRVVALKVLLLFASGLAPKEHLARFRLEALAVAKLQEPHIVQIYDIGEDEGYPYIVLEYVAGGTLAEKLRTEGPMIPRAAAETVAKLARAVHHAHTQGVLHRDLKPSNVLLTPDGQPKVADFGLAKIQELPKEDAPLTLSGMIVGTPSYMAPEQAASELEAIGPAADIYSLGAMLYELLTGRPPFQGKSVMGTLSQIATGQVVAPHTLKPAVGLELSAICLKCLEKEPRKRYNSAKELAEDLERWLAGQPIMAS
jgi:serine/threonine protein kinase